MPANAWDRGSLFVMGAIIHLSVSLLIRSVHSGLALFLVSNGKIPLKHLPKTCEDWHWHGCHILTWGRKNVWHLVSADIKHKTGKICSQTSSKKQLFIAKRVLTWTLEMINCRSFGRPHLNCIHPTVKSFLPMLPGPPTSHKTEVIPQHPKDFDLV